jgi:hypothetical protein
VCGIAMVNLSDRPLENFRGYNGGCSTYGSFSYLKYGPMRLFSQAAQDSQIQLGARAVGRQATAAPRRPRTAAPTSASSRRA